MWAVTVMIYWLKLAAGLVGGCLSVLWLVHVLIYVLVSPPLDPFLNSFFRKMDKVFPLFGTLAFAIFCFYLIGALPASIRLACHLILFLFGRLAFAVWPSQSSASI